MSITKYDPYLDTQTCIDRLYGWWKQHNTLIVAFDYDDTIFDFHKKGYYYPEVVDLLLSCAQLGFTLILFTTKETQEELDEVVTYILDVYGIDVKYVNDSPVMTGSQKPYYNILLDDKAGLGQAVEVLRETLKLIEEDLS